MRRAVLGAVLTAGLLGTSAVVGATPAAAMACNPFIYPDADFKGSPICFETGTNGRWISLGRLANKASSLKNTTSTTWCLRTASGATWNFWGPAHWSYFGAPYNDAFVEAKSTAC
jgi:hypothetical protein